MSAISEEDFNRLTRLWAETFLRVQEMGKLILKHQPTNKVLGENLGINELELQIEKRDKHGNVVHTQNIRSSGDGKIKSQKRWNKEEGK